MSCSIKENNSMTMSTSAQPQRGATCISTHVRFQPYWAAKLGPGSKMTVCKVSFSTSCTFNEEAQLITFQIVLLLTFNFLF